MGVSVPIEPNGSAASASSWVILDNHFHAILSAPDLMQVMRDFKRHTARRILDQLRAENCDWLLNQFDYFHAAHKAQSERQVWQEGFHPVAIADDEMMLHPMGYLHNNPVARGLVSAPEHWRYSSAHEWSANVEPVLHCGRDNTRRRRIHKCFDEW